MGRDKLLEEIESARSRLAALERQLERGGERGRSGGDELSIRLARLKRLSELNLMISGDPMEVFEQVVRAVGELFQVRVVCLSEIAGRELVFKAVYVKGQVFRDAGGCPLAITPCATVESTKDLRLFDRVIERFPQASFLKDHNAFTYCGFPALDSAGQVVAVTCLLDDKPHEFSEEDQALLRVLGQRIAVEIERDRHLADHKRAEGALIEQERQMKALVTSLDDIVFEFDEHGTYLNVWSGDDRLLAKPKAELLGRRIDDVLGHESGRPFMEVVARVAASGKAEEIEYALDVLSGQRWFLARTSPIFALDDTRKVVSMLIRDITERKQMEAALRESERRLRDAQQLARIGNWELDLETNRLFWSDEIFRIFEVGKARFGASYQAFLNAVHPDDRAMVNAAYAESVETRSPYEIVHRLQMPDGRIKYVQERGETFYDAEGRPHRSVGTVQDITEQRLAELETERALQEKEMLLSEVHHRVKNNLQLVSSLLYFQSKKFRNEEDLAVFREGQDRLKSMILVHEKLYRSGNLARVEFGEYVQALVDGVRHSYERLRTKVDVLVEAQPVTLPVELALPAGLIVNELLTNAFKYAFPDTETGRVRVQVMTEGGQLAVVVEDTGVGLPAGLNVEKPATFGLQLVRGLVAQVGGAITFDGARGTVARLTAPLPIYAKQ